MQMSVQVSRVIEFAMIVLKSTVIKYSDKIAAGKYIRDNTHRWLITCPVISQKYRNNFITLQMLVYYSNFDLFSKNQIK